MLLSILGGGTRFCWHLELSVCFLFFFLFFFSFPV